MYFRSSRNPDMFLSELIHEEMHAKEALEIKNLLDLGKTDEEIMSIFGNNWSFEKRAFFHEHAWQEATGMKILIRLKQFLKIFFQIMMNTKFL